MSADPTSPRPSSPSADDPLRLDDPTRQLVRAKAMRIARAAGFGPSDADDLEQDIAAHVWKRLGKFDRSKADQAAFVRMLVAHAAATVLRDRRRQTRRAPPPLARALSAGDTPTEPADERASRREADVALALDVAALLASLPPRMRQLAEALKARPLAAAARHLGVSRATAYARLAELRRAFEAAGLGEFTANRQTLRKRSG